MHIKSNIELNLVHLATLAICPLLTVMIDAKFGLFFTASTIICLLVSAFVCLVFNKFLSRTMKVFITAVLSTFVVTLINFVLDKFGFFGIASSDINYFAVLSTIVLSVDIYYIDTKANSNHYLLRVLLCVFVFAILTLVYAFVKEFLSFGTILGKQLFKFTGVEFFSSITFGFIWLGLVCALADVIYRHIGKIYKEKAMVYEKYVKQIRDEKAFQYDNLRRQNLLKTSIEIKKIDDDEAEEIEQKANENKAIVEAEDNGDDVTKEDTSKKPKKKKKNKKLKVSKEAKVEKILDQTSKEEEE